MSFLEVKVGLGRVVLCEECEGRKAGEFGGEFVAKECGEGMHFGGSNIARR